MTPKFFIIDDSSEYRALLAHHLTSRWPDAAVRDYDPLAAGRLPESFSGAGNDLIFLGHPAGKGDVLDWLQQFCQVRHFPPIIVVGDGDERQIVASIKAGATDYISKRRLSHARLVEIVEAVLREKPANGEQDSEESAEPHAANGYPRIKGYEFERKISSSDVSAVYLARQLADNRRIILKILRQVPDDDDDSAFERFLREYELIARVKHPNIVQIFDLGITDDHAYIAMEFCSRGSLKRKVKKGMSSAQALSYLRQIGGALAELHRVRILHRDLKPTNVMFRDDGSLALIDFGLAKQAKMASAITGAGEIFGTPYYMSPEQGHAGDVDHRGDIYSLGVIFYEMLTGQKPYEGETAMSVIVQHNQSPVPVLPDALSEFQPLVDKMMAKDPDQRFQTVAEMLAAQDALVASPV